MTPEEQPISVVRNIRSSADLPSPQLEIRDRKLVVIGTGKTPLLDLPDGTLVAVVPHKCLERLLDNDQLLKGLGA